VDGTRQRRTKSAAHRHWYAHWRLVRFAHHLGFPVTKESRGLPGAPARTDQSPKPRV
jgi:hypothetical protein